MTTATASDPTISSAEFRMPPGPATPQVLNGLMFLLAPHRRLTRALQARYGDAFTVRLPTFGRAVFLTSPDLVKTLFTAKADVVHAGENPLGRILGPGSLFSMDEDRHLQERRMLLPPFHGDRMRAYDPLIEEEALRAFDSWPEGEEFPSLPAFNTITLRVILRAVFGAEGSQLTELETLLPTLTRLGQRIIAVPLLGRDLGRFSIGARFRSMRNRYDRIVDGLIQNHLDDPVLPDRIDILAMMLRTMLDRGETINRRELADELVTLLVAGHETTSSSLAWTVERLRRNPRVLRRLEDEAAGDASAFRTATILEVQRSRPVIGITGRLVKQPFEIGEWRIAPGTFLMAGILTMHEDERLHQHADRFDPDRYVGRKPDTYAWIPFGGGVRRCIGAAFALMEMDVVMRTMLRHFELLPTDAPPERERFRGVATGPAKGGMISVRRRSIPLGHDAHDAGATPRCPIKVDTRAPTAT